MNEPPTRELLAGPEPLSLDGLTVIKNFLGKTHADARRMFAERVGWRGFSTEDFMWMAPEGLRYYLVPAQEYLCAEESADDWEFCHGLLCSLSFQAKEGGLPHDLLRRIREIADYADAHRARYLIETPDDDLFNEYVQEIRKASG